MQSIRGFRISLAVLGLLILACLTGTAAATSLGTVWKDRSFIEAPFTGVMFSTNGTIVFAGGEQMLLRTWDGNKRWGGKAGTYAAMSTDGENVVQGAGSSLVLMDNTMVEQWTRNMDGQVRAVAISKNGTCVIGADDKGNYNSWAKNGDFIGRTKDDVVKRIAISPTENIIVATTDAGLRIYTTTLAPVWWDNKSGSLDTAILIAGDGSTIITAGGNRLSSHTSTGKVNWVTNPTKDAITDIACNYDCSVIIIGSQEGTVQAIDRLGRSHWTYPAGQWVNAVGISSDASVIAAGGLDGTVYILDRAGKMATKKKMDTGIRPQSLAVSGDGKRIVVADQNFLYGLSVLGNTEPGVIEIIQPATTTVRTSTTLTATPPAPTTMVPVTTGQIPETPVPPAPTQKSPAGILPVLGALAGTGIVLGYFKKR
jgi:WD40 repeat protein